MTGSLSQSYFILDSECFKVGRKMFFSMAKKENKYANEDEDFINEMLGKGEENEDTEVDSDNEGLLGKNNKKKSTLVSIFGSGKPSSTPNTGRTIATARINPA